MKPGRPPPIKEWHTKGDYIAECDTCGWTCRARNAMGVGVRHARAHGHYVRIEVVRAFIYDYRGTKP